MCNHSIVVCVGPVMTVLQSYTVSSIPIVTLTFRCFHAYKYPNLKLYDMANIPYVLYNTLYIILYIDEVYLLLQHKVIIILHTYSKMLLKHLCGSTSNK